MEITTYQQKEAFGNVLSDLAVTMSDIWKEARGAEAAPFVNSIITSSGGHDTLSMTFHRNGSRTVGHCVRSLLTRLGIDKRNITIHSSGHDPDGVHDTDRTELHVDMTNIGRLNERYSAVSLLQQRLQDGQPDRDTFRACISGGHAIYRSNAPVYVYTDFYAAHQNLKALQPVLVVHTKRGELDMPTSSDCIKASYPTRAFRKGNHSGAGLDEYTCLSEDAIAQVQATIMNAQDRQSAAARG